MGAILLLVVFINLPHSSIERVASSGTAELQILICYCDPDLEKGLRHITFLWNFYLACWGKDKRAFGIALEFCSG